MAPITKGWLEGQAIRHGGMTIRQRDTQIASAVRETRIDMLLPRLRTG